MGHEGGGGLGGVLVRRQPERGRWWGRWPVEVAGKVAVGGGEERWPGRWRWEVAGGKVVGKVVAGKVEGEVVGRWWEVGGKVAG